MPKTFPEVMETAGKLEKIGFVDFAVGLMQGVFEIIIKSTLDQLKAYGELVSTVTKDLATYEAEILGTGTVLDAKVDKYTQDVLDLDPQSASDYDFTVEEADGLKEHFIGVSATVGGSEKNMAGALTVKATPADGSTLPVADLKAFVRAKLKGEVKKSRDLLIAVIQMGMQKVVVTDGAVESKLTFHVDAQDFSSRAATEYNRKSSEFDFSTSASLSWKVIEAAASASYSSRKINVAVVNEKSSTATNIDIDILGKIVVNFRTETFPTIEN